MEDDNEETGRSAFKAQVKKKKEEEVAAMNIQHAHKER